VSSGCGNGANPSVRIARAIASGDINLRFRIHCNVPVFWKSIESKELFMKLPHMEFIVSVRTVKVDGNLVDVIELADERVIAIDGESVTLFEDLEALRDLENDDAQTERLSIPL
jgi:hypothetical protein